MKQTQIRVKSPGKILDFLAFHFNGKSRTALKQLLTRGQVCLNGRVVTHVSTELNEGDFVTLNTGKVNYELKHPKVKIVFEDNDIIVIEKGEGLLTVATDSGKMETTAFSILLNYLKKKDLRNRLFVVHRIDRETSGLIMFAKSKEMQMVMQEDWHNRVTDRIYLAIIEGVLEKKEDTIISYLRESKSLKVHSSQKEIDGGKRAVTHYRVVRECEKFSMLKVTLETGRKNQIRAHCAQMGHPIIGDKKYGSFSSPIARVGLHAKVLGFHHPRTQEPLYFETSVPKKFNALFIKEKKKKEIEKNKI